MSELTVGTTLLGHLIDFYESSPEWNRPCLVLHGWYLTPLVLLNVRRSFPHPLYQGWSWPTQRGWLSTR